MDPSETTESDRAKLVRRSFAQHRLAAEVQGSTLRKNSSSCRCGTNRPGCDNNTQKRSPALAGRQYKHLAPEPKVPPSVRSRVVTPAGQPRNVQRVGRNDFILMRRSQEELVPGHNRGKGGRAPQQLQNCPEVIQYSFQESSILSERDGRGAHEKRGNSVAVVKHLCTVKSMEATCKDCIRSPREKVHHTTAWELRGPHLRGLEVSGMLTLTCG